MNPMIPASLAILLGVCLYPVDAPPFADDLGSTGCTCVVVVSAGEEWTPVPRSERSAVFSGTALRVDWKWEDGVRAEVQFVVDASWRGAMRDTVTLRVGDEANCAHYRAGSRYLVVADRGSPGSGDGDLTGSFHTAACDPALSLEFDYTRMILGEMGPPGWRPAPSGRREIDEVALPVGAAAPPAADSVRLFLMFPDGNDPVRVRIADLEWTELTTASRSLPLPPGLYQLRVEWDDGTHSQTYVKVRCEEDRGEVGCWAPRPLWGIRTPLPE